MVILGMVYYCFNHITQIGSQPLSTKVLRPATCFIWTARIRSLDVSGIAGPWICWGQTQSDKRPLLVHWYQPKQKPDPFHSAFGKDLKEKFQLSHVCCAAMNRVASRSVLRESVTCVASLQIGMGQNVKGFTLW